jgi:hypothetical protein
LVAAVAVEPPATLAALLQVGLAVMAAEAQAVAAAGHQLTALILAPAVTAAPVL